MVAHTLRMEPGKLTAVGIAGTRREVSRFVRGTFNRSQVLVLVDNGPLRASGRMLPVVVVGNFVRSGISYDAEYAAAVHNGRRALTIRAKRRADGRQGYLKFTVGGRTMFARQVHQPARAGRPFLATALREEAARRGWAVRIG
jgi:hypothetical protein